MFFHVDEAIANYRQWELTYPDLIPSDKFEKLKEIQTLSSLPAISRPFIYLGAIFSPNDLHQVFPVLKLMATSSIQQGWILQAFVWFFTTKEDDKTAKASTISKFWMELYENDVIEEEAFLNWEMELESISAVDEFLQISKDKKESILKASGPFLTWLKEAEEEDDDDDSVESS